MKIRTKSFLAGVSIGVVLILTFLILISHWLIKQGFVYLG
jgi:hypothetical protein